MGKKKAYKKGVKDTVKLLMPWLEVVDDAICNDLVRLNDFDEMSWCAKNCTKFNERCVHKWLELKRESE